MTVPQAFQGFDQIEGFDPIDKAELVGKPFGVTGVRFRKNDRQIVFAEAEIVNIDGELLAFQDSSTGARDQLLAYLTSIGVENPLDGQWHGTRLYVPRGLRVSLYEATDDRGRIKQAKTYYLTTAGRPKPDETSTPAVRSAKAAKPQAEQPSS